MAIRSVKKIIGAFEVEVTQFPARKALENKFRLLQLLGKPIGTILSGLNLSKEELNKAKNDPTDLLGKMDLKVIGEAIEQLVQSLPPAQSVNLLLSFFTMTKVNGRDLDEGMIDLEFAGDNLSLIYQIFWFVLEVNYKGFLGMTSIF